MANKNSKRVARQARKFRAAERWAKLLSKQEADKHKNTKRATK